MMIFHQGYEDEVVGSWEFEPVIVPREKERWPVEPPEKTKKLRKSEPEERTIKFHSFDLDILE